MVAGRGHLTLEPKTPEDLRVLEEDFASVANKLREIRMGMIVDGPATFEMHIGKVVLYMDYIIPWADTALSKFKGKQREHARAIGRQIGHREARGEALPRPKEASELVAESKKKSVARKKLR